MGNPACDRCKGRGAVEMLDGGILPRPAGLPMPTVTCSECGGYPLYDALRVPMGKGVGPGWLPIVEGLIARLDREFPGWRCDQIKEKFGTLRFYAEPPPGQDYYAAFEAVIDEAERASATTCEECGRPGIVRDRGKVGGTGSWVKTLCDEHAAERNYVIEGPR